mmetsp:Transcript_26229/g.61989  ORF Transcript_26229/g.61989 Transcript_26229/m.61989 type:complete len:376 (-) Transcript_26229:2621-3748(-)
MQHRAQRAHQMGRDQADEGHDAGLGHGRAGGQCERDDQQQPHQRQPDAERLGGGLAERQRVQRRAGQQAQQRGQHAGGGHHRDAVPAEQAGVAEQKGLHRAQRVGHLQRGQVGQRVQHDADHHAGQQQAQGLLDAPRQQQRQAHADQGADESHAGQPDGGQQRRAGAGHAGQRQRHGHRQLGARGAAEQIGVGERVAEQALGHRTGHAQQRAGPPGTQRARQPDLPEDEAHAVIAQIGPAGAADQHAGGNARGTEHQQQREQGAGAQRHRAALSRRQRAMICAASAMRGPGRDRMSPSSGLKMQRRPWRTASMPCQPGRVVRPSASRVPTMINPGLALTTNSGLILGKGPSSAGMMLPAPSRANVSPMKEVAPAA